MKALIIFSALLLTSCSPKVYTVINKKCRVISVTEIEFYDDESVKDYIYHTECGDVTYYRTQHSEYAVGDSMPISKLTKLNKNGIN